MSVAPGQERLEIQKSVRQTCTDLAAKLEQLHRQVIQPVEKARHAMSQTVDTVKDTMNTAKEAVDSVGEKIASWPWTSVLSSLAAGVGTGWLTGKTTPDATPAFAFAPQPGPVVTQTATPTAPGFFQKQTNKLTGVSVGAGSALVRDIVKDRMPDWSDAADQLALDLTTHLGAVPFHGTILPPSTAATANDASINSHASFASSLYAQGA